jgi:peroxiredoxin
LTAGQAAALVAGLLLVVVVSAQAWFLSQLFQQHGRVLARLDALEARLAQAPARAPVPAPAQPKPEAPAPQGLAVGAPAPAFALPDLAGRATPLGELLAPNTPTLLLFMDAVCGPCAALLPEVTRWHREHTDAFTVTIVSRGGAKENRKKFGQSTLPRVLLQEKSEVSDRYSTWGTPSAVVVRPDGRVGSAVASGADAIKALVGSLVTNADRPATTAGARANCGPPIVGEPAPAVRLADLDGHPVALADYRGREALVLFWNPSCGFCQRMLPDLKVGAGRRAGYTRAADRFHGRSGGEPRDGTHVPDRARPGLLGRSGVPRRRHALRGARRYRGTNRVARRRRRAGGAGARGARRGRTGDRAPLERCVALGRRPRRALPHVRRARGACRSAGVPPALLRAARAEGAGRRDRGQPPPQALTSEPRLAFGR